MPPHAGPYIYIYSYIFFHDFGKILVYFKVHSSKIPFVFPVFGYPGISICTNINIYIYMYICFKFIYIYLYIYI